MDTTTGAVIVIALFALIAVVAFLRYSRRATADIQGSFGTNLKIQASNNQNPVTAAVKAKGVTSSEGGVTAEGTTGRGVDVENINAKQEVRLTSSSSESAHPKVPPRA